MTVPLTPVPIAKPERLITVYHYARLFDFTIMGRLTQPTDREQPILGIPAR